MYGDEDAQETLTLGVARWSCRLADLTLAHVIDNRQTAASGNGEVFLRVQDVSCII